MEKLEKEGLRLNERELLEVHGGRSGGMDVVAECDAPGCGWSSGWKDLYEVQALIDAHTAETGHKSFSMTAPNN